MLDENLPTFFLKPSTEKIKHHESFYYTQHGSEPEASYALRHVDPAAHNAKNTYALALFDSRNPEILYGEVLSKPGWSHPSLSQEEIRKNGGVPPPPMPIYPTEFAIQLYNPDSRVLVKHTTAKWSSTVSWEFSLPQVTFRTPSNSDLDRTMTDPGADVNTPRVNFAWRKEGRLGKDMTCYMVGKSTDPTGKRAKKSKEGDIAVAMFSGLKELTIMEPNLYRVEIEDYKGLEVTLLISVAVIRDLFFGDLNEQFHVSRADARKNSGGLRARKGSSPLQGPNVTAPILTPQPPPPPAYTPSSSQYPPEKVPLQDAGSAGVNAQPPPPSYSSNNAAKRASLPPLATGQNRPSQPPQLQRPPQPQRPVQPQRPTQQRQEGPRLDPRAQWEIEAETARLKNQAEAEAREQKRQAEANRRARRRQEEEEERKTLQFLDQERRQKEREEKERQRKKAEIDKETERLKKQFGDQSNLLRPAAQPQRHSAPFMSGGQQGPRPSQAQRPAPVPAQPQRPQGPYLQPPNQHRPAASQSSFFSNGLTKPVAKAKKSFWGLRTQSAMISKTIFAAAAMAIGANAHFHLLEPYWRGSSFEEPASQWVYPCANVNETTDMANRTMWPPTGGSTMINGSHESALTAVNLALGTNVTNFNITLMEIFNQTGAGVFCMKETGRANLEAGFIAAGYSGLDDERINGLMATVQVIQLGHSGSALYNCADIMFNSTAELLSDEQCQNSTGVSASAIENAGSGSETEEESPSGTEGGESADETGSLRREEGEDDTRQEWVNWRSE
ncbi:hypothetical protein TW65_71819 [Stemphylium lycopersici]|nr:hypothetical protein TW65_71819 [Stemphylium lycopersici]